MTVRPKADSHLGWAYRPDGDTVAALTRGTKKLREHPELGSDKPHMGGSGNLAEALVEARKAEDKRRFGKRRRRKMARKVSLKEIEARKGASKKKTAAPASKKRTAAAPTGKLIPLKTLCAEMELDPKATRVKLRRAIAKGDIDFHDHAQRWEFTQAQAKQVRAFLAE